jgi:hypothetical protein
VILRASEKPESGRNAFAVGCIFLSAIVAILPLLLRGNSFGHDFDFHLLSWMETANSWHQGVLYPHWLESANYGAGEPRFVFYPPATWMLGALLGSLTSWTAAPILLIFCSLFLSGVSLYFFVRHWMPEGAAIFAACLYSANPYALFNAYERSAYGELLAGAWLPLLLLFALRRQRSVAQLALATAGVWLTNAPAAVVAGYSLLVVAIVAAIVEREWWPVARAAFGTALGMGITSFYLVPAAFERRWIEIDRAIGPDMRVEDSFLFHHGGGAFHEQVLWTASWIAVVILAVAAVALGVLLLRRKSESGSKVKRVILSLAALTIAITFLLLPWSAWVWSAAPEMRFLQFPWRWVLMQSVATTMLMGLAVSCTKLAKFRLILSVAAVAIVGLMVSFGSHIFFQGEDEDDTLASQIATFHSGDGVEGTDEYTPLNGDNSAIQKKLPMIRLLASPTGEVASSSPDINPVYLASDESLPAKVSIDRWQAESKIVRIDAASPGFAVLRLMDYPGWKALVNSSEQTSRTHRIDGLLVVAVPAGSSRVEVAWKPTRDAVAGRIMSIFSVFVLLPVALLERRKEAEARV